MIEAGGSFPFLSLFKGLRRHSGLVPTLTFPPSTLKNPHFLGEKKKKILLFLQTIILNTAQPVAANMSREMMAIVWLVWFSFAAAANFNVLCFCSRSRPVTIKRNNTINAKAAFVGCESELTQNEKRFLPSA